MNEERKKILKMIEEGLISSEEAEDLLDALDKAEKTTEQSAALSKHVEWDQKQSDQSSKQYSDKKASILGYIEQAFNKIKNADLDFNFGTYFEVSHIFHQESVELSKLDIDVSNGDVQIIPWKESDIRVSCEVKVYQATNQDDAREKFLKEVEMQVESGIMQLFLPSKQMKASIVINVPEKDYDKAVVRLFNGSIDVEKLTVHQLKAKTTNGKIELSKVVGQEWELETTSGSIKVIECSSTEVEAETVNGSIKMDGSFDKVDVETVSGSIHCDWGDESKPETAFLKTTTGSIRLKIPPTIGVDGLLKTNIGSIHCDLIDYQIINESKEMLQRLLHFESNRNHSHLFHVEAEAKTGSIWVR